MGISEFIVPDSFLLISQMGQTVNRCVSYMMVHLCQSIKPIKALLKSKRNSQDKTSAKCSNCQYLYLVLIRFSKDLYSHQSFFIFILKYVLF